MKYGVEHPTHLRSRSCRRLCLCSCFRRRRRCRLQSNEPTVDTVDEEYTRGRVRHAFSLGEKERKLVTARYQQTMRCYQRAVRGTNTKIDEFVCPRRSWLIFHVRANHPQQLNCRQFIWGQPRKSTHTLVDTPRYRTQNKKLLSQVDRSFDKNIGKKAYQNQNVRTTSSPKLMGLAGRHVHSVNVTDAQKAVDTLSETCEMRRPTHNTPRTAGFVPPFLAPRGGGSQRAINKNGRPKNTLIGGF